MDGVGNLRDSILAAKGVVEAAECPPADRAVRDHVLGHINHALAELEDPTHRSFETRGPEELLAVVAHDLQNVLTALVLRIEVMLRQSPDPTEERRKSRGHLEMAHRASKHMRRLVGDLLDRHRLQTGALALSMCRHDAAALVRDVVSMIAPLGGGRVALRAPPAASAFVRCDADRITQVLTNLVANALRVSKDGTSVEVAVEAGEQTVRFVVRDTGPGIPQEVLAHVFEPYVKGFDGGLGLGLYISHGIVEAHGGQLEVDSPAGGPTTFAIVLDRVT